MKAKTTGKVISQSCIAPGIYDLKIETELAQEAHAGQFVGVFTKDASALLPRPISICGVSDDKKSIRLVYRVAGKGTDEFSKLEEGDDVALLGVLGNGYDIERLSAIGNDKPSKVLLLGGGIGIPPMLELAKELHAAGVKVISVMGYRDDRTFLLDEFTAFSETYVATEDGSLGTKGNVLDAVKENGIEFDAICACGPMPMLRAIKQFAGDKPAFISLEERMACGVGACLGCVVRTKEIDHHSHINNARICTDGPVFEASEVEI